MKKMKRVAAIVLALMMAVSVLSGCGEKDKKRDGKEIEISYWNSGLGSAWLDKVIEAFEAKYPEYYITLNSSAEASAVIPALGIPETDTVDLYLYIYTDKEEYLEPLNDILETKIEGETKTIGEKFSQSYLESQVASDGNYYGLTYGGGIMSFVYNEKLFEKAGVEIPRTTNEMAYVCDELLGQGITPLCHFSPSGYWTWINEVFFAQYAGLDYYNSFYGGEVTPKLLTNAEDGRYETLKALEKFVSPDYVLQGSNTYDHATMQTKFLNGEAAMMTNGSWLEVEMSGSSSVDGFKMMRTPVISSIVDRLDSVEKESQLTKLIAAIDSVTDGEKTLDDYRDGDHYVVDGMNISEADWNYVDLARNSVSNNYSSQTAFVPNYSDQIDGAKMFLKYLYSDEGYQVFIDALGITLPLAMSDAKVDLSGLSSYGESVYHINSTSKQFITMEAVSRNIIYKETGARSFGIESYINKFTTKNVGERKTADQYWKSYCESVNKNWNDWTANIK